MSEPRENYGIVQLTQDSFWVTGIENTLSHCMPTANIKIFSGGYHYTYGSSSNYLSNTDIFENGAFKVGPTLPFEVQGHCMVRIDQNRSVLLGGGDGTTPYDNVSSTVQYLSLIHI